MMAALTEVDALALSMLAMLIVTFGMLLGLGVCMFKNASNRDDDVDQLLEDVEEEEKSEGKKLKARAGEKREEWEKDGDWWKGE